MHSLRSSCMLHKDVSIQRRRRPCSGSWKSRSKAYLVTLAEIQDTPACEVARSHSSCILSFDLIGQHQNKRFYVTEIVLPLGFADAIFRRERSDDRKCVCCSQAKFTQDCKQLNKTTETYKPWCPCQLLYLKGTVQFLSVLDDRPHEELSSLLFYDRSKNMNKIWIKVNKNI